MGRQTFRLNADEILHEQQTQRSGLTTSEAAARLAQHGKNQLDDVKQKSTLAVFLDQFKDLLVIILIAAAAISLFSGHTESTIVIFAVIILNAVLGTVQTIKAENSLASLKAMSAPAARVMRDGDRVELPASEVVPGDILVLEAGDLVAADGRILENFSLKVNESALTGESESVEKYERPIDMDNVALGDQKNMVLSGS
ncbi:MAG: HAD-IC family P-type ATPase, partial [Raoultibacter sp.]